MVGNAHLDPAWMWQWGEGMEAFIATCRSALERMEENPGTTFTFTCSSAAHYRWVEETEPELFEQIRARVADGRWAITGGWWVQADCNLPSGEGFARQALLGQQYFLDRFGTIARTGYSPDAFGHNLGLPQILAQSGITAYLFCRPDPTELPLPSPLVRWIGPDGSEVLAYRVPFHYNMYETSVPKKVRDLLAAWEGASNLAAQPLSDIAPEWMLMYGVGNHGGGPTREQIAQIIALAATPDTPTVLFSDPDTFFEAAARNAVPQPLPEWRDDFQMNAPGCYSVHSAIKQLNRKSEHALAVAERFSTLAAILLGAPYPAPELDRAWENVCFNHFHDIICGVAIREALDDATAMYGEALAIAARATRYALRRLASAIDTTGPGQTLVIFNPHSWDAERHVTFELWHDIDKALWSQPVRLRIAGDNGEDIPCQLGFTSGKIGKDRIAATFTAAVPALGWRCYRVFYGEEPAVAPARGIGADDLTLDNSLLRVTVDAASGTISSIYHRGLGRELLAANAARGVVIGDPTDTWGHGVERFDAVIGEFGAATARLVANGPEYATIRARSTWGSSWLQQDFTLHKGTASVHVEVKVFWGEERKMLKLEFPALAADAEAFYESAYAVTRKPCDGRERPGGTWAAVAGNAGGEPGGIGIVNDAKYGYSAALVETSRGAGAALRLTVLRSPSYATHDPHPFNADEDLDFIDQGPQRFSYEILPITAPGWPATLARAAALLNAPLVPQLESAHEPVGAALGRTYGGIALEPAHVTATVVKRGFHGEGWVLRLYETSGRETLTTLRFHPTGATWRGTLAPHGIATIAIHGPRAERTSLTEIQSDY